MMASALGGTKPHSALHCASKQSISSGTAVRRAFSHPASKLRRRNKTQAQPLIAQLFEDSNDEGSNQTAWWLRKRTAVQALGFLGGASLATNLLPSLSLMGDGGDGGGYGDGGGGGGDGNGGHNPLYDLAEDAEG